MGLRNPYTFAVQPGSGTIFINDVGQNTWEEINQGQAGANYGWPATEGATTDPNFVAPLYAYQHGSSNSTGCAITGGTFYNPPVAPYPGRFVGNYFFADYCSGWIRIYNPRNDTVRRFATGISRPVDLQVGLDGNLYYLARGASNSEGEVVRIHYTAPAAAVFTTD